jgi:hypothetical protein
MALASIAEDARGFPSFAFLPSPSRVVENLRPDSNGVVTVSLPALGQGRTLHVVALDSFGAVYREFALPAPVEPPRDLRLAQALDPARHFNEQKQIVAVPAGQTLTIGDSVNPVVEVYDSLARVYALFGALNPDPTLAEFRFVLDWPGLAPERKRELYARYAGHELNVFLARKDPEFFRAVVRPFLANKKDKTFLDRWLLEDDLTPYLEPWAFGPAPSRGGLERPDPARSGSLGPALRNGPERQRPRDRRTGHQRPDAGRSPTWPRRRRRARRSARGRRRDDRRPGPLGSRASRPTGTGQLGREG